jgi:hypothetical protein
MGGRCREKPKGEDPQGKLKIDVDGDDRAWVKQIHACKAWH